MGTIYVKIFQCLQLFFFLKKNEILDGDVALSLFACAASVFATHSLCDSFSVRKEGIKEQSSFVNFHSNAL